MKTRITLTACATLLLLASPGPADMIVPLVWDGHADSGWDAIIADDIHTGIVVDTITDDYVVIEISKTFADPYSAGEFTPNIITFRQRLDDAYTVADIRIANEIIFNSTGIGWQDYHWSIVDEEAAFDPLATDAEWFSVSPFEDMTWGPPEMQWDVDHSSSLDVDGGLVPHGEFFYPGRDSGPLFIDVDLSRAEWAEFTLVQVPTPEPTTMAVIVLGGLVMALRRPRVV